MMMKSLIAAMALTTALPALASESRVVRYDDLNLASPAGMERLDRRIDRAARSICGLGGTARIVGLRALEAAGDCLAKAKASAARQVAAAEARQARGG